jgi:hypothetical protein
LKLEARELARGVTSTKLKSKSGTAAVKKSLSGRVCIILSYPGSGSISNSPKTHYFNSGVSKGQWVELKHPAIHHSEFTLYL